MSDSDDDLTDGQQIQCPSCKNVGSFIVLRCKEAQETIYRALHRNVTRRRLSLTQQLTRMNPRVTATQCIDATPLTELRAMVDGHPSRMDMTQFD